MKEQVLGFKISLLVHGIIMVALFAMRQGKMFENKPIVIDLSIVSRDISSGTAVRSRPSHLKEKKTHLNPVDTHSKLIPHKHPALQKVKPVSRDKTEPIIRQTVPSRTANRVIQRLPEPETKVLKTANSGKTAPTFNDAPLITSGTHETMPNAGTNRSASGVKTRSSTRRQDGGNPENVGRNYVNIHFSYLRERIQKHLCYPTIARKKGWSGKVLVGFTILKNGHVDDLEIKKSCGIKLLDHSAMETVRTACPFPEPPALAKIVIPIMYKLD
jgi:protein TonB